jgi:signal transduction histidine kinase
MLDSTPEEQRDLIETIRTSSRQMQRLIDDLLDVARMETGRLTVAKVPINPASLVREAVESNDGIAAQKRQRLISRIPPALPEICADRDRLMQVFGNLISNAMKFTPERGTILVEAREQAGLVMFSVSDSGPGIPETDLSHIFRPYWQAKKTAHLGAGLGLAIVRGIVEAHGGEISARNEGGGGAVFTFSIPVA